MGPTFDTGTRPEAIAVGDFDRDGHIDAAMAREGADVWVRYGNGFGTFPEQITLDHPRGASLIASLDFDDDGVLDLMITDHDRSEIIAFFGHPTLRQFERRVEGNLPIEEVTGLVRGDFDGDGILDLAVGVDADCAAMVFLGRTNRALEPVSAFGTGGPTSAVAAGDFDGDGRLDLVALATAIPFHVAVLPNASYHPERCRRGNTNLRVGPLAEVLFVNDSPGSGPAREVVTGRFDPFEIRMDAPPSMQGGPARFALYAYVADPIASRVTLLPQRLGFFCMETPITVPSPWMLKKIWNNIGKESILGTPDLPSTPAPSIVLDRPGGLGAAAEFFLQGILVDPWAPSGKAAITNGIRVRSL
jgi:hypothetical protein